MRKDGSRASTLDMPVVERLDSIKDLPLEEILRLRTACLLSRQQRREVSRRLGEVPEDTGRRTEQCLARGSILWILGRFEEALEPLQRIRSTRAGGFLYARCLMECGRCADALAALPAVREHEPKSDLLHTMELEILARLGRYEEIRTRLDALAKRWAKRGELFHYRGVVEEAEGNYEEALDQYEKALSLDPDQVQSLFRLAYYFDLRGEDEMAMEFYERCTRAVPPFMNAFLNLGVLYEDHGEYNKAVECFRRVVKADPNHARARLYLKDAEASLHMYYDEDEEKKEDRLQQILRIPVTDFELSVRSRNCLEKMNLRTLGDLMTKTEVELLAFKNFGETSLAEIKEILASKGLYLGMTREMDEKKALESTSADLEGATTDAADATARPISELELSVRSRRAMAVLGVQTIGDLTRKSEDELRAVKNFGQTSLNEIKRKLAEQGLSLRSG